MSYCKEMGKDQVIFLTEEDAAKPSTVQLPEPGPGEVPQGLVTETGEINWACPCLVRCLDGLSNKLIYRFLKQAFEIFICL